MSLIPFSRKSSNKNESKKRHPIKRPTIEDVEEDIRLFKEKFHKETSAYDPSQSPVYRDFKKKLSDT